MSAGVVHWEISSRNAKPLQDFYSNLFGWLINADNPMQYGLVDTGLKLGINGGIFQGNEKQPPGVVIYVQVEESKKKPVRKQKKVKKAARVKPKAKKKVRR